MLPGKKYTPADGLNLLRRYRWYIIVPAVVCPFVALLVSRVLPNRYQSDALIQVIPQRVPEAYVKSTVTMRIEDRLTSIQEEIRSRPQLETVVREFNLYPELNGKVPIEGLVGRLNTAIRVEPAGSIGSLGGNTSGRESFRVKVTYSDPVVAQKVAERVALMFVQQNQRDRGAQADATHAFLESQLVVARKELEEQEAKLETYKLRHSGSLPTQLESNLQSLDRYRQSLQTIQEAIARDRDQKLMFERLLRDLTADPVPLPRQDPVRQADPNTPAPGATARQKLEAAEQHLAQLRQRLTSEHPDVIKQERIVRELKPLADAEAAAPPPGSGGTTTRPASAEEAARRDRIRERQAEIESLARQIRSREVEEARIRGQIADYERRVGSSPGLESEYIKLNRDYETKNSTYQDLLSKSESSKVSKNLESKPIGEQFRIIDPPRVPLQPASPQRVLINFGGLIVGLVIGLGLVALFELRDSSLRSESDVFSTLSLPVLAQVPHVVTEVEKKQRRQRHVMMSAIRVAGVVVMAGVFVYLRLWNYVI